MGLFAALAAFAAYRFLFLQAKKKVDKLIHLFISTG
jgi:hypothetical protein